ncbi:MAG: restriction endonuclease subunit S [Christensenellales bacterium]
MTSKWTICKIKDVLSFVVDNRGKTPPTQEEGFDLLEVNSVSATEKYPQYKVVRKRVSKEIYSSWFRSGHPKVGDILVPTVGTLGAVSFVDKNDCCIAQNLIALRANPDICDCNYLYYMLCNPLTRKRLLNLNIGGVQPSIKVPHLMGLEIELPDLETQKKIGSMLQVLDAKIVANQKINDNLELQAQAFFQELFVDNADPEWAIGTISDLGAVVGGSTPSKAKPEYYTETGIAWITPKDLSVNKSKFISHGENDITELGLKNSSATIMPEGTVLFSSRAPIGYIAVAAGEVTTNQGFKSIVPKPEIGTAFVYYFLKHNLPIIEGMASGSTFKEVSGSTMKGVPAVIPDTDTIARFNDFCSPIFAQQRILEEQNQSLAALRDNLLPKLMSGEIDVSDIQL